MSRRGVSLADLQAAASAGQKLAVASLLLGVPPQEMRERPVFRRTPADGLNEDFPSSWLNRPTDVRFNFSPGDVERECRTALQEMFPQEDWDRICKAVTAAGYGFSSTPLEKVALRLRKEFLREIAGKEQLGKTKACSMKRDPRTSGPSSAVIYTDANGDQWDEDGVLLNAEMVAERLQPGWSPEED